LTLAAPERRRDFLEILAMRELRTENGSTGEHGCERSKRREASENELRNPVDCQHELRGKKISLTLSSKYCERECENLPFLASCTDSLLEERRKAAFGSANKTGSLQSSRASSTATQRRKTHETN